MGHRANLIVLENAAHELYYCHWCANTLPRDLFWGPQHAVAFVRQQRRVDDGCWLDEVWAEGGAVIDVMARLLLLHGGEDLPYEVPLRRIYLALLRHTWPGWEVRWAYEGIADLAAYAGHPVEEVLAPDDASPPDVVSLEPPEERDWTNLIGSVVQDDGAVRLYPLIADAAEHVQIGTALLEAVAREPGLGRLSLEEWTREFPAGGFHLDLSARRLEFWTASAFPAAEARVTRQWPGWTVIWHRDRYEAQLERTRGHLLFPPVDRAGLVARLKTMLLTEPGRSPPTFVQEFLEHTRAQGKDVQMNPLALQHDPLHLPHVEKERIWDQAIQAAGMI